MMINDDSSWLIVIHNDMVFINEGIPKLDDLQGEILSFEDDDWG